MPAQISTNAKVTGFFIQVFAKGGGAAGGALWEPEVPLTSGARAPFQAVDWRPPFLLFFLLLLRGFEEVGCWAALSGRSLGQSASLWLP